MNKAIESCTILLLDEEGNIKSWNTTIKEIEQYNTELIIGENFSIFFPLAFQEELGTQQLLETAKKTGTAIYEGWQKRYDGSEFWGNAVVFACYDNDNNLTGFREVLFNMTRLHRQIEFEHQNLDALINNTSGVLWSIDRNYKLITANSSFDNMVLQLSGSIIEKGSDVLAIGFDREQLEKYKRFYDRALAGEGFMEIEHNLLPHESWSEISFYPIRQGAEITGTACYAHDITKAKKAEIELNNREHRFRSLIENSTDCVVLLSADMKPFYVSPSVANILGYAPEEVYKMDLFSLIHPDDLLPLQQTMEQVFSNPGVRIKGHTGQMKHKDGRWRWMEAIVTNMLHDPAINGIVDNFRDVTESIIQEQKIIHVNRLYAFISQINQAIVRLKDEESLFRSACDIAVKFGMFEVAWIGSLDTVSRTVDLVAQTGLEIADLHMFADAPYVADGPTGQVLGTQAYYICNNVEEGLHIPLWRTFAVNHGFRSFMILPIKRSGEIVALFSLYSAELNYFNADEIALLVEVTGDLSFALGVFDKENARLDAEQKLEHTMLRLQQAQEIAHFGNWEIDFSTGVALWSEEACRIYGLSTDCSVHTFDTWLSFIHPEDLAHVVKVTEDDMVLLRNSSFRHRIIRKDGEIRHIHTLSHFEQDENGKPSGMYGVAHDVTEDTNNIARLQAKNKKLLEIADIQSHKVRGPLATIMGLANLLDEKDTDTAEILNGIKTSSKKLDAVIREIVDKTYETGD